jgi:hypothetical protein
VVGIGFRKRRQASAVEIDPVVVNQVWILPRVHTACLEPDLPFFFIHLLNSPHDPIAFCDLILHSAGHTRYAASHLESGDHAIEANV